MQTPFDSQEVTRLIRLAVEEDLGGGDVTTASAVPGDVRARAAVVSRAEGVVAGLPLIEKVAAAFGPGVQVELKAKDGDAVKAGETLAIIEGPAHVLLSAERTVLNFLGRLSGIATLTRRFVEAAAGTTARIYDTRKTTPGWRGLEKYAVRVGGGENHRMGLYDQVLIKDNHLAVMARQGKLLDDVVAEIRSRRSDLTIEVEADTEADVRSAVEAGVDLILLDNMTPEALSAVVKLVGELAREKRPVLEASGGVSLETVRAIARSGVDRISVGQLTHSAPALDLAVEIEDAAP